MGETKRFAPWSLASTPSVENVDSLITNGIDYLKSLPDNYYNRLLEFFRSEVYANPTLKDVMNSQDFQDMLFKSLYLTIDVQLLLATLVELGIDRLVNDSLDFTAKGLSDRLCMMSPSVYVLHHAPPCATSCLPHKSTSRTRKFIRIPLFDFLFYFVYCRKNTVHPWFSRTISLSLIENMKHELEQNTNVLDQINVPEHACLNPFPIYLIWQRGKVNGTSTDKDRPDTTIQPSKSTQRNTKKKSAPEPLQTLLFQILHTDPIKNMGTLTRKSWSFSEVRDLTIKKMQTICGVRRTQQPYVLSHVYMKIS